MGLLVAMDTSFTKELFNTLLVILLLSKDNSKLLAFSRFKHSPVIGVVAFEKNCVIDVLFFLIGRNWTIYVLIHVSLKIGYDPFRCGFLYPSFPDRLYTALIAFILSLQNGQFKVAS